MRAALGQRDDPRLGVGRPVVPGPGVAELGGVGGTVRNVELEPVDRQQPPRPQERSACGAQRRRPGHRPSVPGDRAAGAFEQLREHASAEPFAGLRDGAGGRHAPRGVPAAEPVQRSGDLGGDLFIVVLGEQAQPQRQVGDHMRGQLDVRASLPPRTPRRLRPPRPAAPRPPAPRATPDPHWPAHLHP